MICVLNVSKPARFSKRSMAQSRGSIWNLRAGVSGHLGCMLKSIWVAQNPKGVGYYRRCPPTLGLVVHATSRFYLRLV